jgi:two-component system, OmpR family, response regulator CpxR
VRPKKKILLVGDDEDRVGVLRFLLETHRYSIHLFNGVADAIGVDLVLVLWPFAAARELLTAAKAFFPPIPTVVLSGNRTRLPLGFMPDMTLCRDQCSSAEILERIKVLTARKRGPRKGTPAPVKRPAEAQGHDAGAPAERVAERKPVRSEGAGREPGAHNTASGAGS